MTALGVQAPRTRPFLAADPRPRFALPPLASYWPAALTALALVYGVALRSLAFAGGGSLWIDEAMLALNVVERSPAQFLEPLAHNQGAPVAFLLMCKACVAAFGPTEFALRLPAFAGSLVALFAFAAAAFRLLPRPAARLALWLFALAPYLIAYSAECKQYSTDAAATAVLLALAAGPLTGRTGTVRWAALALGGAAAVWVSHPSLFVLAGLGFALLWETVRTKNRTATVAVLLVGMAWLASFAGVYLANLRHLGCNRYLQDYWAGYFLPLTAHPADAFWVAERLAQFLAYPGGMAGAMAVPVALGVAAIARQPNGRAVLVACFAPVAFALAASALKKYPFGGRLLIFLLPVLVLLAARGLAELAALLARPSRLAAALVLAAALLAPALESRELLRHPKHAEELEPVLDELASRWQCGDRLYVYNGDGDAGAGPAFAFYGPRFGYPADAVILGGVHRGEPGKYRDEVNALPPGGRVWLLVSHSHGDEVPALRAHFAACRKPGPEVVRPGAAAYAYDDPR